MKICSFCDSRAADYVSVCPACGASEFKNLCGNCGTVFDTGNFCPKCGIKAGTQKKTCPQCSTEYFTNACPNCGYTTTSMGNNSQSAFYEPPRQRTYTYKNTPVKVDIPQGSRKNKWTAFLLCLLGGYFGLHKFYEGKIGMGILYLFTGGLFYIGVLIDLIAILTKPNEYTP